MPARASFRAALLWSYLMKLGEHGLSTLLAFLLAAILGPERFGLVAMATAYLMLARAIVDQGLSAAIVQRADLQPIHLDSAFWMVAAGSVCLTGASLALSGWWAGVNDLPQLGLVIAVLSAGIPLDGLVVIQQAWLQRELDIRALAIRTNVAVLCGGVVGLAAALSGFGVWALVAQQLVAKLVSLVLLWGMSPWRPRLRFSRSAAADLFRFSSGTLLSRLGIYVNSRSDAILMGLFFGPTAVGIYRLATRLVTMVNETMVRSVHFVSFPELSQHQGDRAAFTASLERSIRFATSASMPLLAVFAATSPELLTFMGLRWAPAVGCLSVLCIAGMLESITMVTGPLLQAAGRPHALALLLWSHAIPSAAMIAGVAMLMPSDDVSEQAMAIAASRTVLMLLVFLPIAWTILVRVGGLRTARAARALVPPLLGALVGIAVAGLLRHPLQLLPGPRWLSGGSLIAVSLLGTGLGMLALDTELRSFLMARVLGGSPFGAADASEVRGVRRPK